MYLPTFPKLRAPLPARLHLLAAGPMHFFRGEVSPALLICSPACRWGGVGGPGTAFPGHADNLKAGEEAETPSGTPRVTTPEPFSTPFRLLQPPPHGYLPDPLALATEPALVERLRHKV